VSERRRPSTTRENEARLEERQVEAPTIEGHEATGPVEQGIESGQQRRLLVEIPHEMLNEHESFVLEEGRSDQEGVRAGAACQSGRLGVEEEEPARVGRRSQRREQLERRHRDVERITQGEPAVAMRERIFASDDDERAAAGVHDLSADEALDRFGDGPCGPHVLDAPDDPAKLFERAGAAVQISG